MSISAIHSRTASTNTPYLSHHYHIMAETRILLTGADTLTGSHILAQLLSYDSVSVRAVVQSRDAAQAIYEHYHRSPTPSLDFVALPVEEHLVHGAMENALRDMSRPFGAVLHTLIPKHSDAADCLSTFVKLETEEMLRFLSLVQRVAPYVRRVVIVSSLTPFARWLIHPPVPQNLEQSPSRTSPPRDLDAEHILATSQASSSTMYDAILQWTKISGARFDIAYVSTPSVYGPSFLPLETSSDLSETNRRIWNICSNEPPERTQVPPYGISHYADVRVSEQQPSQKAMTNSAKDIALASIRALFVTEASNRRFLVSAGAMPPGYEISEYLVRRFPELRNRVRMDNHRRQHSQHNDASYDFLDSYLVSTVLGISELRTAEVTISDTVRQILDLQQRKAWKSIIHS